MITPVPLGLPWWLILPGTAVAFIASIQNIRRARWIERTERQRAAYRREN